MTDYLKLFQRIPDDIVLSVATRDLALLEGTRCLCGWALRESIARASNVDAGDVDLNCAVGFRTISEGTARAFGGRHSDWSEVFYGVAGPESRTIERAWVDRIDEAVRRA